MKTKICVKCGVEKQISEFYSDKRLKSGVMSSCKECIIQNSRLYEKSHKDIVKIKKKNRYLKNREISLQKQKIRNKKRTKEIKECSLKRNFGITLNDYNKMVEAQNGVCAICGQPETDMDGRSKKIRSLAVDHNHKTGKVRGLLCGKCNKAIGGLKDNIKTLESALNYLKKFELGD